MDIHKNARLTPHGRERLAKMILSGQTPETASEAAGVCPRTGRKWRDRFEQEGLAGLQDRSSRPKRLRKPTPPEVVERIASLRRQRMPGNEIAATVSYHPEFCQRIVKLMAEGRSLDGCAALLGVHPDSLYEWQKVHPEFSVAVRAGRAAATTFWENRLLDVANGGSGNAQAIQWALRNRSRAASGWHHDSQKVEHSGPDAPVAIEASAGSGRLNIEQMSWEDREALRGILLRAKAAAEGQAKIGHSED